MSYTSKKMRRLRRTRPDVNATIVIRLARHHGLNTCFSLAFRLDVSCGDDWPKDILCREVDKWSRTGELQTRIRRARHVSLSDSQCYGSHFHRQHNTRTTAQSRAIGTVVTHQHPDSSPHTSLPLLPFPSSKGCPFSPQIHSRRNCSPHRRHCPRAAFACIPCLRVKSRVCERRRRLLRGGAHMFRD